MDLLYILMDINHLLEQTSEWGYILKSWIQTLDCCVLDDVHTLEQTSEWGNILNSWIQTYHCIIV